ncbi:Rho-binding antiterminator [Agarivorans litoreus]|uniref:Rho-binding antiterminator n=1 Tax=Agarivorans litoreus TaxID=1510455 RepID=UPI001C7DC6A8
MISCNEYDYIEIACMFRYSVKLILRDASVLEGIAVDTFTNQQKQECIKLQQEEGERLVLLDSLKRLQVFSDNPRFTLVDFA